MSHKTALNQSLWKGCSPFYALVVFVVVDYITGLMAAAVEKKLSSEVGFKGIFKKVIIFSLVGVGHIVDTHIIGEGSAAAVWIRLPYAVYFAGKITIPFRPWRLDDGSAVIASTSEARFDYYQIKRNKEPLFQMNGASYGWLWQIVCLNHYLQTKAWRKIICPVLIFQADQ